MDPESIIWYHKSIGNTCNLHGVLKALLSVSNLAEARVSLDYNTIPKHATRQDLQD